MKGGVPRKELLLLSHVTPHQHPISPQTNVALVAPLLRLENNHCHIEESEHVLKKAHKYSELIILYEKKGLHEKGDLRDLPESGREAFDIGRIQWTSHEGEAHGFVLGLCGQLCRC